MSDDPQQPQDAAVFEKRPRSRVLADRLAEARMRVEELESEVASQKFDLIKLRGDLQLAKAAAEVAQREAEILTLSVQRLKEIVCADIAVHAARAARIVSPAPPPGLTLSDDDGE